jgi:Spy/CpxP family protein refolding chaperone
MNQHWFRFAAVTTLAGWMVLMHIPVLRAQPGPTNPPEHPVFGHPQMMEALNLTTTQKQQANTIFSDARQKAQPIREDMRQNREALDAAVKANNTSQIESLSSQWGILQGKAQAIRSTAMAKFYAILTPEQRIKADQIQSQMRQRMRERMRERKSEKGE